MLTNIIPSTIVRPNREKAWLGNVYAFSPGRHHVAWTYIPPYHLPWPPSQHTQRQPQMPHCKLLLFVQLMQNCPCHQELHCWSSIWSWRYLENLTTVQHYYAACDWPLEEIYVQLQCITVERRDYWHMYLITSYKLSANRKREVTWCKISSVQTMSWSFTEHQLLDCISQRYADHSAHVHNEITDPCDHCNAPVACVCLHFVAT